MAWEREKAYRERRAAQAAVDMEKAITDADRAEFEKAWASAMRYMRVRERNVYYRRFLQRMSDIRRARA